MDFSTFDFAAPEWFALTLLLPFLVVLKMWSRQQATRGVDAIVARRLQGRLVQSAGKANDWIQYSLQLLALLAFIVALARPQWGVEEVETVTEGRNIVIAIDTSRSMLAEDLKPNRLTRAKLAAQDLVQNMPHDRIGYVVFASKAFALAPLTVDHQAVLEAINQTDTEVIPVSGTNLVEPIELTLKTLAESEAKLAAMIIFSDGEDHDGQAYFEIVERKVADAGLVIICVGVGSEAGAIIPDPSAEPGVFVQDNEGNIVRSRLESSNLRRLSDAGDGLYLDMDETSSVPEIVRQALNKLDTQTLLAENRSMPIERYYIPLLAGMIFLMLSYTWPMMNARRSRNSPPAVLKNAAVFVLGLLASAALMQDASADADGLQSFETGDYEAAQKAFEEALEKAKNDRERSELSFARGAAAYQRGDLETAKNAFGQALGLGNRRMQEFSHYNLGNTLYNAGRVVISEKEVTKEQWEAACEHYRAALQLNNGNNMAARNLKFVEQQLLLLEEQQQQDQNDQNQDQEQQDQQDQQNQQDQQDQNQEQQEDEQQDDKENENQENQDDPGEEENQPPDDPEQDPDQDPNDDKGDQKPPENENDGEGDQDPESNPDPNQPPPQDPNQKPEDREWSPSEARQILENNSDEDKNVKMQEIQVERGSYKNW